MQEPTFLTTPSELQAMLDHNRTELFTRACVLGSAAAAVVLMLFVVSVLLVVMFT